jgi:Tfp pilus assembly protein PilN
MQATVNKRLWAFVEGHGGVKPVSLILGVTPQTLYNIRDNRTFPSAGTLALIKQQFPKTNINAFLSEEEYPTTETGEADVPAIIKADYKAMLDLTSKQAAQIEKLEAKIDRLEEKNDRLTMALLERAHPDLFTEKEESKIGSDNHVAEKLLFGPMQDQGLSLSPRSAGQS